MNIEAPKCFKCPYLGHKWLDWAALDFLKKRGRLISIQLSYNLRIPSHLAHVYICTTTSASNRDGGSHHSIPITHLLLNKIVFTIKHWKLALIGPPSTIWGV